MPDTDNPSPRRPDVVDWGIVGENAALRAINTADRVDMDRYWETNRSVGPGLMVDDIETVEELVEAAKINGRRYGYTLAISAIAGPEVGEFQGFVQYTLDPGDALRKKIEETGLFVFFKDVVLWEVSYAKYPPAGPRQVASAVRQGCVYLAKKAKNRGPYPRIALIGSTDPGENPASLQVLKSSCFDPIGTDPDKPAGIIQYEPGAKGLDAVWLLNWNVLQHRLREKAAPERERCFHAA